MKPPCIARSARIPNLALPWADASAAMAATDSGVHSANEPFWWTLFAEAGVDLTEDGDGEG